MNPELVYLHRDSEDSEGQREGEPSSFVTVAGDALIGDSAAETPVPMSSGCWSESHRRSTVEAEHLRAPGCNPAGIRNCRLGSIFHFISFFFFDVHKA